MILDEIGKDKMIWVRNKLLHENALIIKALVCLLVPPPTRKEGRHRSKLLFRFFRPTMTSWR